MGHRRRADDRAESSYLQTLCQEAGERFNPQLTKAQASERIDELQSVTGRSGGS